MADRAKMLERVRALLAKADSTTFPAEADSFRAKADQMMVSYAIEQWQVDAAQEGTTARAKPERRDVDFAWFWDSARSDELWTLMTSVAYHCRCVVAVRGFNSGSHVDHHKMPIIGLPSDLDYFDMLFTHLMLQMGKGLEPKPDPAKAMIENLVALKESGMKWERIGELLYGIGQLDKPYTRNTGVRFTKLYTDHCVEHDRPRLRTSPSVYQRSFAIGFVQEVGKRFRDMRKVNQEQSDGSLLPAVRDIRDQVKDAYDELFPRTRGRSQGRSVARDVKVDWSAYGAGTEAGRNADISGNPQHGLRKTPELDR